MEARPPRAASTAVEASGARWTDAPFHRYRRSADPAAGAAP
jgi:hypothetical protein